MGTTIEFGEFEEEHGLTTIMTGGGCTALYQKVSDDRYILVTDTEGCSHPEIMEEDVLVGFYKNIGDIDQVWEVWDCMTFQEFVGMWFN